MTEPVRIAMWSGPRNISTAMMRAFENRPDTEVSDEPFYAYSLVHTGINHPGREEVIASMETDWRKIAEAITGNPTNGIAVWYQKHMAHHMHGEIDLDWIWNLRNCFLIRDPREVILSYSKKFDVSDARLLGFHKQEELFHKVLDQTGEVPPVLDAKDVLENPAGILSELCGRVGIPFTESMLSWPEGRRSSDGIWAKYWYRAVEGSTGFEAYRPREGNLTESQMKIYDVVLPVYEKLHEHRMKGEPAHVSG